tara:strand:- start:474 stop:764 length:291 start_codon:yes stop_codon:yes gene_type:complete
MDQGDWFAMAQDNVVLLKNGNQTSLAEARLVASDYYAGLTLNGWGLFRMIEAHGFQPMKAKHIIPLDGHTSYGYLTEAYVIECLAIYLAAGGEPLA